MRPGQPFPQNLKITSQKGKLQDDLYPKYRSKNPRQKFYKQYEWNVCVCEYIKDKWVYLKKCKVSLSFKVSNSNDLIHYIKKNKEKICHLKIFRKSE